MTRAHSQAGPGEPMTIFARFTGEEILAEMGRLAYAALNTFALAGHRILLFDNLELDRLDEERPYLQTISSLDNITRVSDVPSDTAELLYLFDRKDSVLTSNRWRKTVQVGFDIYSSHFLTALKGVRPVLMPYPMHPLLYGPNLATRLEAARSRPRKARIFFSGDTEGYKRNRVSYPEPKLTRSQVVDTLQENLGDRLLRIEDEESFRQLQQGSYQKRFAFVDNNEYRIPPGEWLESLALGDFFLAPPGYVMPMCHNVVEAMAVGTIPLTNYPEWMTPDLEDGVNCVAFSDQQDLLRKVELVLGMESQAITEMKSRVIDYYRKHLDPARFAKSVMEAEEQNILLLMITDGCVARNPGGLNRRSILLTGQPQRPSDLWRATRRALGF